MSTSATTTPRVGCPPLLNMAAPEIYRSNLFRVLALPVHATGKDVQRLRARRQLEAKLGISAPDGFNGTLRLAPPPTDEGIRAAWDAFHRPTDRILHEVFWLWPVNDRGDEDPALKALQQGQTTVASDLWAELSELDDPGGIATHNLAVLDHLIALDYEYRLSSGALSDEEGHRLKELWKRSFNRWRKVCDGEEFWDTLKSRIRQFDDMQLTTGFVRRIRESLPSALLLINAKIAYSAAERSDQALVERQIRLLREADFGDGLAEQSIHECLRPLRNRIKTAIDSAKSRWTSSPQRADRYVRELHEHIEGLLPIVDAVLPTGDLTRTGLHDMAAAAILEGQVAFGRATNQWRECIELLDLAKGLNPGESIIERLDENTTILKDNEEQGNDWCSPGYWDLPEETLVILESAREKNRAGDHAGALDLLLSMDPAIGSPFRRCVSFTLSELGWGIAGAGLSEFNNPSAKLRKFLDVIHRQSTVSVPNSEMESWMLPACPCCNSTSYSSWVKGEYDGQQYWMCSSCSSVDDAERDKKKRSLATAITRALEYVLLAAEVDKRDAGIRRSVGKLKKLAKEIDATVPRTEALKTSLGEPRVRSIPHAFDPAETGNLCSFCGECAADKSCQITVPMHGDRRTLGLLFGEGVEYRLADVAVPRCRRCRDEHRELPGRIEKWREERLDAADPKWFPEPLAEIEATASPAQRATQGVEEQERAVADAQSVIKSAENIGKTCATCHSDAFMSGLLCKRCDGEVFSDDWLPRLLLAGFIAVAVATFVSVDLAVIVFLGGEGFLVAWTFQHWQKQRALRRQRQAEVDHKRQSAVENGRRRLEEAQISLRAARQAAVIPIQAHKAAIERLKSEQTEAIERFESLYPEPSLTPGIKPESHYVSLGLVATLLERDWELGPAPMERETDDGERPINVEGLVGREPRQAAERVLVRCPTCNRLQSVRKTSEEVKVACQCGGHFECLNGRALKQHSSSAPEDGEIITRRRILAMARGFRADAMIACPLCHTKMKAKSLVRHCDRHHNLSANGGTD